MVAFVSLVGCYQMRWLLIAHMENPRILASFFRLAMEGNSIVAFTSLLTFRCYTQSIIIIVFRSIVHGRRWKGMSYICPFLNRKFSWPTTIHKVMDPKKYFVVTFALFSNGEVCDLLLMDFFFLNVITTVCISPPRLQTQLVSKLWHWTGLQAYSFTE